MEEPPFQSLYTHALPDPIQLPHRVLLQLRVRMEPIMRPLTMRTLKPAHGWKIA